MDAARRQELTEALSDLSQEIAAELLASIGEPGPVRQRAQQLHADEKVGEDFDVWADLLSRRAAVLWVLKTVYVRVLEDRGFVTPRRIVDADGPRLFERLAPNLGETAYLRWIFRDLAQPDGGLPELFSRQPAELCPPSDALSHKLLTFWRQRDPDTGELLYAFTDEHFDGSLMGDLYQDLDPVVKDRFALVQTPDFIVDFILDETLTPSIETFGVDNVRVLDPACGSGHFLLAAFKRLVAGMREVHPDRAVDEVVRDVLPRVVGIDFNDYACALARARLVMTALELMGKRELSAGADLHPQVYWADALEQVEAEQLDLDGITYGEPVRSMLTPVQVREALAPVLRPGFQAVVGNPPFDAEPDPRKREYHREKVGRRRRYEAAMGKYPLASVFAERFLGLACHNGFVGLLCGAAFMKRQSGKGLIEKVFPRYELTKVVDLAGIPVRGAGIATLVLFARSRQAADAPVTVVMCKRGDWQQSGDGPGRAWASVAEGHRTVGYESDFISVEEVPRSVMHEHPWSLAGGGAATLKMWLEQNIQEDLSFATIGVAGMSNADDIFIRSWRSWRRLGVEERWLKTIVNGEDVRDWGIAPKEATFFPYDDGMDLLELEGNAYRALWPYRTTLERRAVFSGGTYRQAGRPWYEWHQLSGDRYATPLSITFGEIASHNHFALDRGGRVFNRQAPIIKLDGASLREHFTLLAQLNAAVGDFWTKQVFHIHVGSKKAARWEYGYQRDGSKLARFPLATRDDDVLAGFAETLDELARVRAEDSVEHALRSEAAHKPSTLRDALVARRKRDRERLAKMVGLQEELDWHCYRLYGLDEPPIDELRPPAQVEPLRPGERPFELLLAQRDAAVRAGQRPGQPTTWFERHGWQPTEDLATLPASWRGRIEARLERIASSKQLELLEQPSFKRRWAHPDYEAEERATLKDFVADCIEDEAARRDEPFTARQIAASLQGHAPFEAAAELLEGRGCDLDALVARVLHTESVPQLAVHVFTAAGLRKHRAWMHVWAQQRAEDEANRRDPDAGPEKPPKFARADYRSHFYAHRKRNHDVPRERFISYTEAPGAITGGGDRPFYGWAGWTPIERAKAAMLLDERAEEAGCDVGERHGLLYVAQSLIPQLEALPGARGYVDELRAILRELVGTGVTEEMLSRWAQDHPLSRR